MLLAVLLAALPPVSLTATSFQLPNGLTVIVSPDTSVPGVAIDLWYNVGSKDEEPGRTGFAHLFEHLMFMGARHAPYPRFDTVMEQRGGRNNAATGVDETHYYETGPSNLLETFFWLEADRMATLGEETTADKLEAQRKVVLNERRQSYENQPYGVAELALVDRLFPEGHPYHWPTIGSARDLEAARLDDVKRFFARWYVPSNAFLAVVGDVEPAQVEQLARRYFGWMPRAPVPAHATPAPARLAHDARVTLKDKVEVPKLVLAWLSPAVSQPGHAECDLLARILAKGKASRLYRRLVHERELAVEISAAQEPQDLQGAFHIEALARPGHTLDELRAAIDAELQALLAEGPTPRELEGARQGLLIDLARQLEGLQPRALMLNRLQHVYGSPNALPQALARFEAVTPGALVEVGRRVLRAPRLVIEVQPETPASGARLEGASR